MINCSNSKSVPLTHARGGRKGHKVSVSDLPPHILRLNPALAPHQEPAETSPLPTPTTRADYGRCPHTGRPYRSRTEARWAVDHLHHRYEALAITTPCGTYWPDFVCGPNLYEVKGGFIRDRAMHKVKAAIRPALELGFDGIWLAQWRDGRWTVTEVQEGSR